MQPFFDKMSKTQISDTGKHNFNCMAKIPCAIFRRKNQQTMFNSMYIFEISYLEFVKKTLIKKTHPNINIITG